jgi:hypothetical protein
MKLSFRWAVWSSALALSACSVLIDPDSLVIKCQVARGQESNDPCLSAGMHCIDGECRPCRTSTDAGEPTEICNGIDDDCDGVIDNGADQDHDGFTWCGGGRPELADCSPNDSSIHPAGETGPDNATVPAPPELCDGKDNDCDSKVDEASECSAMHSCVTDGCPMGQRCDASSGVCIVPRPVGSGCTADSECAGGFCLKKGNYGLGVTLTDDRCASACCTDSDCANGSVCVVGDSGVRVCLPSNVAGRAAKAVNDRCSADDECASGTCAFGRCAQRCSSDDGCKSGGSVCALSSGSLSEARRWLCGDPAGREQSGASCAMFDLGACRSGYCTERNACAKACGRDADCGADETCNSAPLRALIVGPTSMISYCEPRISSEAEPLCCTNVDCAKGQLCEPKSVDSGLFTMSCH